MRRRLIVGIGLLFLTTGCLARGIGRVAADLPQTRPLPSQSLGDAGVPGVHRPTSSDVHRPVGDVLIPVLHPPDAMIIAREPRGRRGQLDAALMGAAPVLHLVNWSLFAVAIAF